MLKITGFGKTKIGPSVPSNNYKVRSGPYLPEDILFTYLPNFTDITKYNNANTSNNTTKQVDSNQTYKPLGIVEGIRNKTGDLDNDTSVINPTLTITNEDGNIYQMDYPYVGSYSISFWVKINRFPTKIINLNSTDRIIRKKRARILSLRYLKPDDVFTTGAYSGEIEFGVMGPHYIYDNTNYIYKGQFYPLSFTCTITYPNNNFNYCTKSPGDNGRNISIYTDYLYSLNEWYFITLNLNSGTGTISDSDATLDIKLYVNNVLQDTAFHKSKVITNRRCGRMGEFTLRASSRHTGQVAAGPDFIDPFGNTLASSNVHNFEFYKWFRLNKLKEIETAPFVNYVNNTVSAYYMTHKSTGIDYGQLYIYKEYDNKLYYSLKHLYKADTTLNLPNTYIINASVRANSDGHYIDVLYNMDILENTFNVELFINSVYNDIEDFSYEKNKLTLIINNSITTGQTVTLNIYEGTIENQYGIVLPDEIGYPVINDI